MKQITDRQKEVLEFIADFTETNVYPPTVREISEHFGISLRAVQDHIAALQPCGARRTFAFAHIAHADDHYALGRHRNAY